MRLLKIKRYHHTSFSQSSRFIAKYVCLYVHNQRHRPSTASLTCYRYKPFSLRMESCCCRYAPLIGRWFFIKSIYFTSKIYSISLDVCWADNGIHQSPNHSTFADARTSIRLWHYSVSAHTEPFLRDYSKLFLKLYELYSV